MRRFVGFLLIVLGGLIAATPHVIEIRDWLPSQVQNGLQPWQAYAAGAAAIVVGLALVLVRRRRKQGLTDDRIREIFKRRRFVFTAFPDGGWLATGTWDGAEISARWECGYNAGRFGRQWVIVVTLPGKPADPLPLSPTQAVLVDRSEDRFSAVLPEAGLTGGHDIIPDRIDQLLMTRQTF